MSLSLFVSLIVGRICIKIPYFGPHCGYWSGSGLRSWIEVVENRDRSSGFVDTKRLEVCQGAE